MAEMSAELQSQLLKLNRIRTYVNRQINSLETFIKGCSDVDKHVKQIQCDLDQIKTNLNEYEQIELASYDEKFESSFPCIRDLKTKYFVLESELPKPQPAAGGASDAGVSVNRQAYLPTVNLENFDGNCRKWLSFKNSFKSLIDNNETLSNVQKFQYLKSALQGNAADIINSLEVTADKYEVAFNLIQKSFENTRIIVNSHLDELFNLPIIEENNLESYRGILNSVLQHVRALESMKRPVQHWDDMLVFLIVSRLPPMARLEWENKLESDKLAKFVEIQAFLTQKCQVLQTMKYKNEGILETLGKAGKSSDVKTKVLNCYMCKREHMITQCDAFLKLDTKRRLETVRAKGLCTNCLRPGHIKIDCKSNRSCRTCHKKHNSLLHFEVKAVQSSVFHTQAAGKTSVCLATGVIDVLDFQGNSHKARVLLDSGSEINLITKRFNHKLNLNENLENITIAGVGINSVKSQKSIEATIGSRLNSFQIKMKFLVLDQIMNIIPEHFIEAKHFNIPENIQLADPGFNKPDEIDMILGAEHYHKILGGEQILINGGDLALQESKFGWIISGKIKVNEQINTAKCNTVTLTRLESQVRKLWEIENVENIKVAKSSSDVICENFYNETTVRDSEGRFTVALPWKEEVGALGSSYNTAYKRFISLENRLEREPNFKLLYDEFMAEYISLGHMKRINLQIQEIRDSYFLPHHGIFKQHNLTTKLRVVFDASAKSSSGKSLNDCLNKGPALQNDIFDILVRFRTYQFVLTADIKKMYRQIRTKAEDNVYQRVLWRFAPHEKLQIYELQTVTYGTCCAPYLAVRCLNELAEECDNTRIKNVIKNDFYMDDVLTGASSIKELEDIRDNIQKVLSGGGFELHKWAANDNRLIKDLENQSQGDCVVLSVGDHIKTLGIKWDYKLDSIIYEGFNINLKVKDTKRNILSAISQFYDPLGLLGPVIILAKILLQQIWQLNLGWDVIVPKKIGEQWRQLVTELNQPIIIRLPRKVITCSNASVELHAFGDASEKAYGTAIYIKSVNDNSESACTLWCAKSRVAPLKVITLPRLELCAAVLTAQVVNRVKEALPNCVRVYYYTDSKITLSWIKSPSTTFKTFVSHRVGEIHSLSDPADWYHVEGAENPADIISRGVYPAEIKNNSLWWHGPQFIQNNEKLPVFVPNVNIEKSELRVVLVVNKLDLDWVTRISTFKKLVRVMAWILRFKFNSCKINQKKIGNLTVLEIEEAEFAIIRMLQRVYFKEEIETLKRERQLKTKSPILSLNPFLDTQGILRVGGRLRQSNLPFEQKHQILLPAKHYITELIITDYHEKSLHSGTQGTLAAVRNKYWPISGRNAVRRVTRHCVTCFRAKPQSRVPIMADLPNYRIEQVRPFVRTGIDYGGPIFVKEGRRRNSKLIKTYIALFVCMATKAIHLELVSDLTTEAFLGALRRFTSRRGMVAELFSDNATNFVGANKELKSFYNFINENNDELTNELSSLNINWHFIPARAPHFGGLWEAGIKQAKAHLRRLTRNANLTYEEMYTCLTQIEAILNSRPLSPLSNDPNDLSVLTPGHFLIGEPLTAIPDPNLQNIKATRLSRWQYVQQIKQHFWKRWQSEYLQELQTRRRWKQGHAAIPEVGDLVLVRDDGIAACQWKMGRIADVHPGKDGHIRVATVRTRAGIFKRPVVKLCVFPKVRE